MGGGRYDCYISQRCAHTVIDSPETLTEVLTSRSEPGRKVGDVILSYRFRIADNDMIYDNGVIIAHAYSMQSMKLRFYFACEQCVDT